MADPDDEISRLQRELARAEEVFGAQHASTVSARMDLGRAYQGASRAELAVPLLEQAVAVRELTLGPLHPDAIIARVQLAHACYLSMRLEEARALYERAAEQSAAASGPLYSVTLLARSGAAGCLLETRRYGEAIAAYQSLLSAWAARKTPASSRHVLNDRYHLACAADASGDSQEAVNQYWRLLADCDRFLGPGDPLTRRLAGNMVPPPRPWHAAAPLSAHQLWLVSLSAVLTAREHGGGLWSLYPRLWLDRGDRLARLRSPWGIQAPGDLPGTLEWLAASGARAGLAGSLGHEPVAFDLARYCDVVRAAFAAEYIGEADAWQLLARIAGHAHAAYGSWREFAGDYLAARQQAMDDGADRLLRAPAESGQRHRPAARPGQRGQPVEPRTLGRDRAPGPASHLPAADVRIRRALA